MPGMKHWPDPEDDSGSGFFIMIEFWVVVAVIIFAVGAGYAPALIRLFEP